MQKLAVSSVQIDTQRVNKLVNPSHHRLLTGVRLRVAVLISVFRFQC